MLHTKTEYGYLRPTVGNSSAIDIRPVAGDITSSQEVSVAAATLPQVQMRVRSRFQPIEQAVDAFLPRLGLAQNWDGEQSPGYDESTLRAVKDFLLSTAKRAWIECGVGITAPELEPGPEGSIDVHWLLSDRELLLNVPNDTNNLATFYGDNLKGEVLKGTLYISADNQWLLQWLVR